VIVHTVLFSEDDDFVGVLFAEFSEEADAHSPLLSFARLHNWIQLIVITDHHKPFRIQQGTNRHRLYYQTRFIHHTEIETKAIHKLVEHPHDRHNNQISPLHLQMQISE